jgi:hypothetical protein
VCLEQRVICKDLQLANGGCCTRVVLTCCHSVWLFDQDECSSCVQRVEGDPAFAAGVTGVSVIY